MKYSGIICLWLALSLSVAGQDNISTYLAGHHYAFNLEKGFEGALSDTLKQRLANYRLILQAEGGSHDLKFYSRLEFIWLRYLQQRFGITHFVGESGPASAVLFNRYLTTGDSTLVLNKNPFWKDLYNYNSTLPGTQRLHYIGLDFDWPRYYFKALKTLLPDAPLPAAIQEDIQRIREVPDSMRDCDYAIRFNTRLKQLLSGHQQDLADYFGRNYTELVEIVSNRSNCKDTRKNRNPKMAARFFESHRSVGDSLYFGEFGAAHTRLNTHDLAWIIDRTEPFPGKVCVFNLYCHHCSVPGEEISNWPLHNIEPEILRYFLPYCDTAFTLFDLSADNPVTKPYRAYGQFLIIAKDQR